MAAGAALPLAYPRTDWAGTAWVALAPVLLLAVTRPARASFGWGWVAGFIFFLLLLRWLNFTFGVYSAIPWPLTWAPTAALAAYCGFYVGLVMLCVSWVAERRGRGRALAAAPFLWVTAEWLRGHLLGGFPWGHLGYSQHSQLAVIQVAELAGVDGVALVVVAVNAALAGCVTLSRGRAAAGLAAAAVLLAGTIGFGLTRLAEPEPLAEARVALMQPAIEQPLKWDEKHTASTLRIYGELTRSAAQLRPALIVWPETASPTLLRRDRVLLDALSDLARASGVTLLVGSVDVMDPAGRDVRNTAFLLTEQGIVGRYDKIHLVPFGEYVPLSRVIGFVRGWAQFISELTPGSHAMVFPGPPAPFGVVICYEGIFPALFRRFVQDGARLMVNMTNDAWFGRTSGPLQHLAMYPFRAVEHRTALVRVANTGVSAFIDPRGRIVSSLGLFERGILSHEIALRRSETLYTRFGDWLAGLSAGVSALALIAAASRRM
ncbi:MAG TPA: apolipoprotein N-acyltransferase [Methylomirabilota bacterium]|nr:apolipoprotein N-acyltransferase [Methylomirabilota bacterium]